MVQRCFNDSNHTNFEFKNYIINKDILKKLLITKQLTILIQVGGGICSIVLALRNLHMKYYYDNIMNVSLFEMITSYYFSFVYIYIFKEIFDNVIFKFSFN